MALSQLHLFLSFEILSEQMEYLNEITQLQRDIFHFFCYTIQVV